jgi:TPR repeat protein
MSLEGRGGPRDVEAGLGWLEKCAALNLPLCLYEEAALYYTGYHGVPVDSAKAMALGTRASELGDRSATWGIAKLYLLGKGTPEDAAKGMALLRSLSDQGYARATGSLGELYGDDKIRNEFFDGSFDGEDRVPDEFKAAVHSDMTKALGYWEAAAQQGNCHSLVDLSSVYDRGAGVPLNYSKGAKYVADAVKCSPTNSFYLWKLGKRLTDAKGLPRDCVTASTLFLESMMFGYSDAAVELGYIYDKGCDSILRDDKRAFQIYLQGAKAGVPLCQNNVGAMLKHGRGVGAPDTVSGYAWLMLAVANGNELAARNLTDNKDLFPEEVRKQGLEHLEVIKNMIHGGAVDMQLLASGDMTY